MFILTKQLGNYLKIATSFCISTENTFILMENDSVICFIVHIFSIFKAKKKFHDYEHTNSIPFRRIESDFSPTQILDRNCSFMFLFLFFFKIDFCRQFCDPEILSG